MRRLAPWVTILGLAACGDGGPGSGDWAGSVKDSAGITVVTNPAAGAWTDETRWRLEEVLAIGEAAGDPDYQFGVISGIAVLSDERLWVLDQLAQEVKVFSPDGVFERRLGSAGSGPGEFGPGTQGAYVAAGDTVFILDLANQRVNRFLGDGSFDGSFRIDIQSGIPLRVEMRPSGLLVSQLRPLGLPGQDSTDVIVTMRSDGTVIDTLAQMPSGRTFSVSRGSPEFHFFTAEPAWTLLGTDEIVLGTSDQYRLEVRGPDGSISRIITVPFAQLPITEEDRDAFTASLVKTWEDFGVPPEQLKALRSGIHYADFFPALAGLRAGPAGSLWVQKVMSPTDLLAAEGEIDFQQGSSLSSPDWDVLDSNGRFLGVVTMPDRFQPVSFVGDRIYGVWRDEFDVQYVRALRIVNVETGVAPEAS